MPDAVSKFPSALLALADVGGEYPGVGENEWTANGATTAAAAVPFSLVVNGAIAARVPATGWLTTANNEILHYSAYVAATKTFTIDLRAQQDTAAAAIDSGSAVGQWLTKRAINQILAELVALETQYTQQIGRQSVGNITGAVTANFTLGSAYEGTLTGNVTFTFTAPPAGTVVAMKLLQDATGSRTVTWPASVKWPGGTAPTLTTTASKADIFTFYFDGTNYFGQTGGLNY